MCGDCLDILPTINQPIQTLFSDWPDNINLKYNQYRDKCSREKYLGLLETWIQLFTSQATNVWLSFNNKWLLEVADIVNKLQQISGLLERFEFRPCIQTVTFGQNRQIDLSNCIRPLWRFHKWGTPLYPDQIRLASWRQLNNDPRADPRGKVPSDHFDFPRVTGNSKQRRSWHPTQLNEGLVERCLLLTTKRGELVVDPFLGSGTTMRVCQKIGRDCIGIDVDKFYCEQVAQDLQLKQIDEKTWADEDAIRLHTEPT